MLYDKWNSHVISDIDPPILTTSSAQGSMWNILNPWGAMKDPAWERNYSFPLASPHLECILKVNVSFKISKEENVSLFLGKFNNFNKKGVFSPSLQQWHLKGSVITHVWEMWLCSQIINRNLSWKSCQNLKYSCLEHMVLINNALISSTETNTSGKMSFGF